MIKSMTCNLMVENVKEATKFYVDVLDFKIVDSVDVMGETVFAILNFNDINLMFQQRKSMIEEYDAISCSEVKASVSLYMEAINFQELYEKCSKSHTIYKNIHETFYGTLEFSVLDVDGYVLTFSSKK